MSKVKALFIKISLNTTYDLNTYVAVTVICQFNTHNFFVNKIPISFRSAMHLALGNES